MNKLLLEAFLPYRLARAGVALSEAFRRIYESDYDLTVPEWRVLATLGEMEEMSAREIGAHSLMHKTKVSRAVRSLEERRWLKRRECDMDRREEILQLTPSGRRTYDNIVPRARAFEAKVTDALGTDEEAFLRALSRLEKAVPPRRR